MVIEVFSAQLLAHKSPDIWSCRTVNMAMQIMSLIQPAQYYSGVKAYTELAKYLVYNNSFIFNMFCCLLLDYCSAETGSQDNY